jgi:hypothetical protein
MKARPRSVENRTADALNEHFARLGMTPVERIPVLGRTGPDLSINEMKLVVDVKSRIEVPKALFFPLLVPFRFDGMVGVRVKCLNTLWEENAQLRCGDDCPDTAPLDFSSKTVRDYLAHLEEWTRENCADGVSCVVLHRPDLPIGSSVAIIQSHSRRRLIEYARDHSNRASYAGEPVPAE